MIEWLHQYLSHETFWFVSDNPFYILDGMYADFLFQSLRMMEELLINDNVVVQKGKIMMSKISDANIYILFSGKI